MRFGLREKQDEVVAADVECFAQIGECLVDVFDHEARRGGWRVGPDHRHRFVRVGMARVAMEDAADEDEQDRVEDDGEGEHFGVAGDAVTAEDRA